MVSDQVIAAIRQEYVLPWEGLHGWAHWLRVRENGLRLAALAGANAVVVELFAFLHDARRQSDGRDPQHGPRAAALVCRLQGQTIFLPAAELELLAYACQYHTRGWTQADVTVQVCWDADRLDLGRIGIRPHVGRLCTAAAQDPALIEWAWGRSQEGYADGR